MRPPSPVPAPGRPDLSVDDAWSLLLAASAAADVHSPPLEPGWYGLSGPSHRLERVAPGSPDALLRWTHETGWTPGLPDAHPARVLLDLYLPICGTGRRRPAIVGHLGQSLDGFIATRTGDSQFVTGHENILHLHRMRALSDAIVVGAGTVVADDPQLNTRHVRGPNPVRVVLDPARRLGDGYRVFQDGLTPTLYACDRTLVAPGETHLGGATIVGLGRGAAGLDLAELVSVLRDRGCARLFVEGGGVTVSAFLQAGLLDRLQVAVAPFVIGDGRPAIRLPGPVALRDCRRPRYRVFRMGPDVLFDCDYSGEDDASGPIPAAPLARII